MKVELARTSPAPPRT